MDCILSAMLVKSPVGERPGVIPRNAEVGVGGRGALFVQHPMPDHARDRPKCGCE